MIFISYLSYLLHCTFWVANYNSDKIYVSILNNTLRSWISLFKFGSITSCIMMAADHADDIESVHFAVVHDDSYTYIHMYLCWKTIWYFYN